MTAITKENMTAAAERLVASANRVAHGLEVSCETAMDTNFGKFSVTITFTDPAWSAEVTRAIKSIARKAKSGNLETSEAPRRGRPPKNAAPVEEQPKRGPGRPPKTVIVEEQPKRGPGRPPKNAAPAAPVEQKRGPGRPPKNAAPAAAPVAEKSFKPVAIRNAVKVLTEAGMKNVTEERVVNALNGNPDARFLKSMNNLIGNEELVEAITSKKVNLLAAILLMLEFESSDEKIAKMMALAEKRVPELQEEEESEELELDEEEEDEDSEEEEDEDSEEEEDEEEEDEEEEEEDEEDEDEDSEDSEEDDEDDFSDIDEAEFSLPRKK